jgi:hypothetical protein
MVKHIYRYQSLRSPWGKLNLERLLLHGEVYCPPPLSFNDPFDCLFPISDADTTDESIQTILKCHIQRRKPTASPDEVEEEIRMRQATGWDKGGSGWEEWSRLFFGERKEFLSKFGVVCFSEVRDDLLMWGHYADGHRGVCLQFDRGVLDSIGGFGKVKYFRDCPSLNDYAKAGCKPPPEFFILRKSDRWCYEQEWRLWRDATSTRLLPLPTDALTGVVLGCEMPPEDEEMVRGWAGQRSISIPVVKALISGESFGIDIRGLPD